MAAVPFLPKNAPFTAEDIDILNQLVQRSSPLQRSWLSGFLAGLDAAQGSQVGAPAPVAAQRPRVPLTILYGSESGNTESLALKAKKTVILLDADQSEVGLFRNLAPDLVFSATSPEEAVKRIMELL